jgi:hypothetical protein
MGFDNARGHGSNGDGLPKNLIMIPVVLNIAPHERKMAKRFVRYVKELDGTDIRTFEFNDPPGMVYPEVANWCFKRIAEEMRGQIYCWLECDSPPIAPGWLEKLEKDYARIGLPYMMAAKTNPPFDLFGGVGVYGPNTADDAPEGFKTGGFDEWLVTRFPEKIGRTELIRHSYGIYDDAGNVTHHVFPRDEAIIGDKAVVVHKDQQLSLLPIMAKKFNLNLA